MSATATAPAHTEVKLTVCGKSVRVLKGGAGPALVALHHSTGSIGWTPIVEELAKAHTVYVIDMPGYGQSERPDWARDPRDIAVLCGFVIDSLGLDKVTLVGFGFGGYIAAELATMNQARLTKLVLVGSAGIKPREGEIMDEMLMDIVEYVEKGFRDRAHFEAFLGAEPDASVKELFDFSREMSARITWKPYMFSNRLPPLLAGVKTPTTIIWGGADAIIPASTGEQFRAALPNARLEVIPGAGHYVEHEEPARVAALING
jgi:pimeloyl-ACP methyl ester carboxylesterase